jgi:hypothetical protein
MARARVLLALFATLAFAGVFLPAAMTPSAAATGPTLSLARTTDLAAGGHVLATLTHLPAATSVQFAQCDDRFDPSNAKYGCDARTGALPAAKTNSSGALTIRLTVGDPLYLAREQGDPLPVYCRADQCRIFAVWTSKGVLHTLASPKLQFRGSPATIIATPATDLTDGQKVVVKGTAAGAYGQTVVVVEEDCFHLVQETGCEGTVVLGKTVVQAHGLWQLSVNVPRVLPDGIDCSVPGDFILDSTCQLTARVMTSSGVPDDSFGISRYGDPRALLSFVALP